MKTFLITSRHDVYQDDYEQGELQHVNGYSVKETISAENWIDAINTYFSSVLCYDITVKDCESSEDGEELQTSVLVDNVNCPATKEEIKNWKRGGTMLYSNNITVDVSELVSVKLKD